jgi:hypothetical protein
MGQSSPLAGAFPPQSSPCCGPTLIFAKFVLNLRQNIYFTSIYILKNSIQGCQQFGIFFANQDIKQYQTQIKAIIAIAIASSIRMGDK